jgi:hypothetical protein
LLPEILSIETGTLEIPCRGRFRVSTVASPAADDELPNPLSSPAADRPGDLHHLLVEGSEVLNATEK